MTTVRPKKHLGQHFLTDKAIAQKIVSLLQPLPTEQIIEIGPGKGVLTEWLLGYPNTIEAIEYDTEASVYLKFAFAKAIAASKLSITEMDFLLWRFPNQPIVCIGNLPYNITSPIVFQLLAHANVVRRAVFMVQKEVAQRICAQPGQRECGLLTVLVHRLYTPKYAFTVKPGAFYPPPNVNSAVMSLERKENIEPINEILFTKVVKTAFNQRRKTLHNALKANGYSVPDELSQRRTESLSLSEFIALAKFNGA